MPRILTDCAEEETIIVHSSSFSYFIKLVDRENMKVEFSL